MSYAGRILKTCVIGMDAKEYFEKAMKARQAQILQMSVKKYVKLTMYVENYRYELEEACVNPENLNITLLYRPAKRD